MSYHQRALAAMAQVPIPKDQDLANVATTAAFGAFAGGIWAASKQMSRKQVAINTALSTVISASLPQVLMHAMNLPFVYSWFIGVMCGVLVLPIMAGIERYGNKKIDQYSPPSPPASGGLS